MPSKPNIPLNRRNFLRAALGEAAGVVDEFRTASKYQLSELFNLTDQQIRCLKPVVYPEVMVEEQDGQLIGFTLEDDDGVQLFESTNLNKAVLAAFTGTQDIGLISKHIAITFDLDPMDSFQLVKNHFFTLAKHSILTI